MTVLATSLAIVSFASLTACNTRGYMRAANASDTMAEAATEVETARRQIDEVTTSLNALVLAPTDNLGPAFEEYRSRVLGLQKTVGKLKQKAQDMEAQGTKYFDAWDVRLSGMRNEDIRSRSEARQRDVSRQFADLRQQYFAARRDLDPLVSNLDDLRASLGVDLTAAGINEAREFVPQIEASVETARRSLDELARQLHAVGGRLQPGS